MSSIDTSRYFTARSTVRGTKTIDISDSDDLAYYEYIKKNRYQPDPELMHQMYEEWNDCLFGGQFNIALSGIGSKLSIIDTYKLYYLDRENIVKSYELKGRKKHLEIVSFRIHGQTPISEERFCHVLMELNKANADDIEKFGQTVKKVPHFHYVFLLNSFELLMKDSPRVCNIIFKFCTLFPQNFHFILSLDLINGPMLLPNNLRTSLNIIFFRLSTNESFAYEKLSATTLTDRGDDFFDEQTRIESLKTVYMALQPTCKKVLEYILKVCTDKREEPLLFEELYNYCARTHFINRSLIIRAHLNELEEHNIVKASRDKLACLLQPEVAEKFLKIIDRELKTDE